jgi:hypothetical protein
MIQGFETRETTDIPIRAFVKSVNGVLHKKKSTVDQYEQTEWQTFENLKTPIAVFGILRGTGDLIKKCLTIPQIFYYFDHAYTLGGRHGKSQYVNDKVYRITKNDYSLTFVDDLNDKDYERIEKYKKHIELKPWKKEGRYILVLAPSHHIEKYFHMLDWVENTVSYLKQFTKRDIIVRTKETTESLEKQLEEAYACVSLQSTGCIDAVLNGVPSFCDGMSCGQPVSQVDLSLIEKPFYVPDTRRKKWIDSLLANQFTLKEIEDGTAYEKVSRNNMRTK